MAGYKHHGRGGAGGEGWQREGISQLPYHSGRKPSLVLWNTQRQGRHGCVLSSYYVPGTALRAKHSSMGREEDCRR